MGDGPIPIPGRVQTFDGFADRATFTSMLVIVAPECLTAPVSICPCQMLANEMPQSAGTLVLGLKVDLGRVIQKDGAPDGPPAAANLSSPRECRSMAFLEWQ